MVKKLSNSYKVTTLIRKCFMWSIFTSLNTLMVNYRPLHLRIQPKEILSLAQNLILKYKKDEEK